MREMEQREGGERPGTDPARRASARQTGSGQSPTGAASVPGRRMDDRASGAVRPGARELPPWSEGSAERDGRSLEPNPGGSGYRRGGRITPAGSGGVSRLRERQPLSGWSAGQPAGARRGTSSPRPISPRVASHINVGHRAASHTSSRCAGCHSVSRSPRRSCPHVRRTTSRRSPRRNANACQVRQRSTAFRSLSPGTRPRRRRIVADRVGASAEPMSGAPSLPKGTASRSATTQRGAGVQRTRPP